MIFEAKDNHWPAIKEIYREGIESGFREVEIREKLARIIRGFNTERYQCFEC